MLKPHLYRFAIHFCGRLPLSLLRLLGSWLGNLLWLTRSRMWLVTRENIDLCFAEMSNEDRAKLARASLKESGKTMAETTFAWTRAPEIVLGTIESVTGDASIQQALNDGHGIVFVIPHQGNWEIINHFLGRHYGLTHMFQPTHRRGLDSLIQRKRSVTGTQFVPAGFQGIRAQLKILHAAGCIGVMPDQEPQVHTGEFVPFFGIPALTNELLSGYVKHGAKMFIAVCERSESGFNIKFDPVPSTTAKQVPALVNAHIESAIRRKPEQYLWSYKRFRTRPEGEPDFYESGQHPIRAVLEASVLGIYTWSCRYLPATSRNFVARVAYKIPLIAKRRRKTTKINLQLTEQPASWAQASLEQTFQTAIEAPWVWTTPDSTFSARIEAPSEAFYSDKGAIVLTPPLGNREALIRFLAGSARVTEYYYPNSTTSLDLLIRNARTARGIKLVDHDDIGREHLCAALTRGEIATLSPDQQPRLRSGIFVPFFDKEALTALAIPELLRKTQTKLYLGAAIRDKGHFLIQLKPLTFDKDDSDQAILHQINSDLEQAILANPDQYRWSDKRFNIRPNGEPKVYR